MNLRKICVLALIFTIYSFSLGFYTFYGVFKSYNEYFCRQRRPDKQDYYYEVEGRYLNFSALPNYHGDKFVVHIDNIIQGFGEFNDYISFKDDLGNSELKPLNSNSTLKYKGGFHTTYSVDDSYFKLECLDGDKTFYSDSILRSKKKKGQSRDLLLTGEMCFNRYGYLKFCPRDSSVAFTVNENVTYFSDLKCKVSKSSYTCETKQETSDKFYKLYIILVFMSFLLVPICFLNINNYYLLRVMNSFSKKLRELSAFNFCNPIHGEPVHLNKGSKIMKLSVVESELSIFGTGPEHQLKQFRDLRGEYFFNHNKLCIKVIGKKGYLLHLKEDEVRMIKNYFYEATMDPDQCVVDDSEEHYLETEDVLNKVSMGMKIISKKKSLSGYILKVDALLHKFVIESFEIKKDLASFLLKHNELFFGKVNIKALEFCLDGKMRYFHKPSDVKNSQWKWYTSDFCKIIMEKSKSIYTSQVNWYPSVAMVKTKMLDASEFELASEETSFETKILNEKINRQISYVMNSTSKKMLSVLADVTHATKELIVCNEFNEKVKASDDDYSKVCSEVMDCSHEIYHMMISKSFEGKSSNHPLNSKNGFEKAESDIVEGMNKWVGKINSYKDVLLNPPKFINTVKEKKVKEGAAQMRRKYGKHLALYEVEEVKKEVEHRHFSKVQKVLRSVKKVQSHCRDYIIALKNGFSELQKDSELLLKDEGEPVFINKVSTIELSSIILDKVRQESKLNKANKKKRKQPKKSSKRSIVKNKQIKRKAKLFGISKYFSSDFNEAVKCSGKIVSGEEFHSDIRPRAVVSLAYFLKREIITKGVGMTHGNKEDVEKTDEILSKFIRKTIGKSHEINMKFFRGGLYKGEKDQFFTSVLDI